MFAKLEHEPNPAVILRNRYVLALSLIALLIIASQVIIQMTIISNDDDGRVINIAGRQRMLSQKIAKLGLLVVQAGDQKARQAYAAELDGALSLWQLSHQGLLKGSEELRVRGRNSPTVVAMYQAIQGPFDAIYRAGRQLAAAAMAGSAPADADALRLLAAPISENEPAFLEGMNAITFQYDQETKARLDGIRNLEYILLVVTFLALSLEAMFIFLPAERQISRYFRDMKIAVNQLKEQASHDEMTGLFNKGAGLLFLGREMDKASRAHSPLTLCFLDMDGLKTTNDQQGHETGDAMIQRFAQAIQAQVRSSDLAFRYGGDEFVLVLAAGLELANEIIGRIRKQLSEMAQAEELPYSLAFSAGVAPYQAAYGRDTELFIEAADALMYQEKKHHHEHEA